MLVGQHVQCRDFPCGDVRHGSYVVPGIDLDPEAVQMVMISEAAPVDPADFYYAGAGALFEQTTVQAFVDAGAKVGSIQDILDLGVYLTPAVKCAKTGYGIATSTILECSRLLEAELALFPRAWVYWLMGDVAIRALNAIAKRLGEPRPIPTGPTYKIRGQEFTFRGIRVYPSYLQAGPSFFIEKSKRRMIAEDIAHGLGLPG